MLFNSYSFVFLYLPITLLGFFSLGRRNPQLAGLWLVFASFIFYAWWNPIYVLLLAASIGFNYLVGLHLAKLHESQELQTKARVLFLSIASNLILLAYYKYTNFFADSLNELINTHYNLEKIILPIGISFFTFTQIAFLVDVARGYAKEFNIVHYCLFVTYFPHLIAGPVLHHKEMMPQFAKRETYLFNPDDFALGLTLFFFGLFKKLILADNIAVFSTPVFEAASHGMALSLLEAWGGALSYTFQLYFDFSGYSDMAIGLSRMMGVKLPINFNSPYKSANIIDFWRRWHMTLSRFLRDYLYIPLGGNRKGVFRRYINLFATMLLGGLWHGANWTYLVWGGLHGVYLIINHLWQGLYRGLGYESASSSWLYRAFSTLLTFLAVVVAWVFFRADSFNTALSILKGMAGYNGLALPMKWIEGWDSSAGISHWLLDNGIRTTNNYTLFAAGEELRLLVFLLLICWFMPNTVELFALEQYKTKLFLRWKPSGIWAFITIVAALLSILSISALSEFIYFQF